MTQERLSVRTIREVLRLKYEIGLSNRAIARACRISNSTVGEYITRAKQAGWSWPLPEEVSEEELYRRLFPEEKSQKVQNGRFRIGKRSIAIFRVEESP